MKLPRYWAKGSADNNPESHKTRSFDTLSCWGWSDVSLEDARERGRQRALAVAEMMRNGKPKKRYLYGDRPLREMIIQELKREDDSTYAAVTRNSYGCEVLNTANAMFVDVDLQPVSSWETVTRGLKGLFGKTQGPSPREQQEVAALAKLHNMVQLDPQCSVRVYRTHSGLRYLLTHSVADPVAETTLRAMDILGADPLYVKLCKVQECFRARLTPKPWRCGASALRISFPWKDQHTEIQVDQWIQEYTRKMKGYATCSLIHQLGSGKVHGEIASIIRIHDEMTKAESGLPLA